jgi:nitrogen regulatory protein PII
MADNIIKTFLNMDVEITDDFIKSSSVKRTKWFESSSVEELESTLKTLDHAGKYIKGTVMITISVCSYSSISITFNTNEYVNNDIAGNEIERILESQLNSETVVDCVMNKKSTTKFHSEKIFNNNCEITTTIRINGAEIA